jgi:hypothetical protein
MQTIRLLRAQLLRNIDEKEKSYAEYEASLHESRSVINYHDALLGLVILSRNNEERRLHYLTALEQYEHAMAIGDVHTLITGIPGFN